MPWMRARPRPRQTSPRTVIGLWLRAMIMGEAELRRQLGRRLNSGKVGFNRDEAGVVQAGCELAVRRLWGTDYEVRDITAAVTFMREANLAQGNAGYGQLEMEAVIRSALGEADVDVSGISRPLAYEVQAVVTAYVAMKLEWRESDIVRLIAEAERIAAKRGWHPPVAT